MEKHLKTTFQFGFVLIALLVIMWVPIVSDTGSFSNRVAATSVGLFVMGGLPLLCIHFIFSILLLGRAMLQHGQGKLSASRQTFALFVTSVLLDVIFFIYLFSFLYGKIIDARH